METKGKKIKAIIKLILSILLIIVAADCLIETSKNEGNTTIFGYSPAIVQTGSMLPVIQIKGTIITKLGSIENCEVGDIIVYRFKDKQIVHRVISKNTVDDKIVIHTKGDNNKNEDMIDITSDMYVGKVVKIMNWTSKILG